jgi:hypothetical protein
MSRLSKGLSELARNVHKVTELIRQCQAKEVTAADRAALRDLVTELAAFVHTRPKADN